MKRAMKRSIGAAAALCVGCLLFTAPATFAGEKDGLTSCEMSFSMKGWSAFYKKANGEGEVVCENGERASVKLKMRGGGLTFGKSEILQGTGKFSGVKDISEIFGGYAAAEAHGGAAKSASAGVMTKGEVSLALAGKGRGVDIGIAFSKLKITRR